MPPHTRGKGVEIVDMKLEFVVVSVSDVEAEEELSL